MLNSVWPLHMNRLSDHQDILPDIQSEDLAVFQQNFYGTDSVCSSETQKLEDLCYGLTDPEQEEPWPYSYRTDNSGSYHVNSKINFQDYSFLKNFKIPPVLSETSKDCYQKRDAWISPLNKHNLDTDLVNFDMINHSKSKQRKCSIFQDFDCTKVPSEFPCFDAEAYAKLLQAKQNCLKQDNFIPDQNYSAAKATHMMTDRPCVCEYDNKTNYELKTFCGGNSSFLNQLQKVNQMRHDLQNPDYFKSVSLKSPITNGNSNSAPWLNGHTDSNYCNQLKVNSVLSNAQKSPNPSSNFSSVRSPLTSNNHFQKYSSEHPAFPSFEYSADGTQEGYGKTREERIFEFISDQRLKPFNGVSENESSLYSPLENTRKKIFSDKKQGAQYNVDEKMFEDIAKSYKVLLDSALNYNSPRQGSGETKPLNESKLTLPQNTCFSNGMIDELRNNLATTIHTSNNFRSQVSPNFDHTTHPIIDNFDSYPYKDLRQVCPRFSDLLQGNASIHGLAPAFNMQRLLKPRSITAGEFHLHLEECYDQCRALEKDRKRTESILVKHYPGKKVSSTNSTPIPRLTANPSRVDRLIVDQLREQARVATLLGKMERFRSSPLHANISTTLDRYLEAIHIVQTRRKDEIINTSNRQKHSKPRLHDDRDVFILASSIKDMATATRKARTALWCALQMTLPKMTPAQSPGDLEHVLQTFGKAQG